MLTVTLNPDIENRLNQLVSQTHKDKNFYVERALEYFLEEYEDELRILSIKERIDKSQEKLYSLEEIKRMYHEENK